MTRGKASPIAPPIDIPCDKKKSLLLTSPHEILEFFASFLCPMVPNINLFLHEKAPTCERTSLILQPTYQHYKIGRDHAPYSCKTGPSTQGHVPDDSGEEFHREYIDTHKGGGGSHFANHCQSDGQWSQCYNKLVKSVNQQFLPISWYFNYISIFIVVYYRSFSVLGSLRYLLSLAKVTVNMVQRHAMPPNIMHIRCIFFLPIRSIKRMVERIPGNSTMPIKKKFR